ncbi:2-hydroxyacyl-CoA dehydratase subunit D [Chloroflexota bacterium]
MKALEELTKLVSDIENPAIREWKEDGGKVVGLFCGYVPEEILYAANILPYRIRGTGCTSTAAADEHMFHQSCSVARANLQLILEGKYNFLDGIVFEKTCDPVRRLYDLVRVNKPTAFSFIHFLQVPHKCIDEAVDYYKGSLVEFKKSVEKSFGVEITEDSLRKAINVYNETRTLLKKLYELRQGDTPPISGTECLNVLLAGMSMPKDKYNQLLRRLLSELNERQGIADYRARLIISGSGGCDDIESYQLIEKLGGLIVTDTLCFGSRYFWESVETEGDLMLNLARSYIKRPACAKMTDRIIERHDFLEEMVKQFKVDGVIFQVIRHCQLWGGQLLVTRRKLDESNIPLLVLDREYPLTGVEQLKTRVEAFIETIGGV